MATFVVERNLPGISMEVLGDAQKAAIAEAAQMQRQETDISYVRSLFVPETGRCMCLFSAASIDDVKALNDAAKLPYDKISPALDLDP